VAEKEFENKVALVTGGSRGIGAAIALRFAGSGAEVFVNHRKGAGSSKAKAEELQERVALMGGRLTAVASDISSRSAVKEMMETIGREAGRLDFLILNAARAPFKPIERLLERELRDLIQVNYMGNIFCVQEALPLLEESAGKIVFISSLGSRFFNPAYPLGSMKAAMEAVVRDLAESLRPRRVTVNAVSGGIVKTDSYKVLRQHMENLDQLPEHLVVEAEEIADVTAFLCSPAARGICGQTIVCDRGMSNALQRF